MRQPAVARGLSLIPLPAATQHAVMSRPDMLSEAAAACHLQQGPPVGVPVSPSAQTALPPQQLVVSEEVQSLVAKAGAPHRLLLKVRPAPLRANSFWHPPNLPGGGLGLTVDQAEVQTHLAEAGDPQEPLIRVRSAGLNGPCSHQSSSKSRVSKLGSATVRQIWPMYPSKV